MNKKIMQHKKKILVVFAVVLLLLSSLLAYAIRTARQEELNQIYGSFTANCCDGTLRQCDAFCALGIKENIEGYYDDGYRGEELFDKTARLLGVNSIVDHNLRLASLQTYRDLFSNDTNRAVLQLSDISVDFGNVSESKDAFVIRDFYLKNIGEEDLYIYNVETSCSCLETKIVTPEKESPTMGRFSFPYGMNIKIEPGKRVILRVQYDARVNSYFRGHETRWVYVKSNDIVRPTQEIRIDVNHID